MNDSIINPKKFLIKFYQKIISNPNGSESFLKDEKFKRDREYWAISMVLIGLNKMFGTCWWIKESDQDPPDGLAITYKIEEESNILIKNTIPIEVLFVPKYIKKQNWNERLSDEENIFNFINEKKFENKAYEPSTHLIIYFNLTLKNFSFPKLCSLITNASPKFKEIWCIAALDPLLKKCLIAQLYPDIRATTINIDEYLL